MPFGQSRHGKCCCGKMMTGLQKQIRIDLLFANDIRDAAISCQNQIRAVIKIVVPVKIGFHLYDFHPFFLKELKTG